MKFLGSVNRFKKLLQQLEQNPSSGTPRVKATSDKPSAQHRMPPRRVTFCEDIAEHIVPGRDEIDRTATADHANAPWTVRGPIFQELVAYIEKEMPVHRQATASTKHEFLYNTDRNVRFHVQKRVREANKALGIRRKPQLTDHWQGSPRPAAATEQCGIMVPAATLNRVMLRSPL